MTIQYTLHNIRFEWDSEKANANFDKHGVTFESACEVFFDPFVMIVEIQESEGEVRTVQIGMTTRWQILYVVQTERNDEVFRIISARQATRAERKKYEAR